MRKSPRETALRRRRGLAVVCALALAAAGCGDGSEAESTDALSQDLLSSIDASAGQQGSVPMPTVQEQPTMDVAELGYDMGSAEAPIRVVEMSDYGCSYCRKFHMETWPVLRERFVAEGKVEWKFLPFINGMFQHSLAATRAAECALEQSPETFEAMNARLWEGQREWKGAGDPQPVLQGMAQDAGADMETWEACMADERQDERIAAATALARQTGVRGTPTFFVVGYPPLQGALPAETFVRVLDMVYADATQGGGGM